MHRFPEPREEKDDSSNTTDSSAVSSATPMPQAQAPVASPNSVGPCGESKNFEC